MKKIFISILLIGILTGCVNRVKEKQSLEKCSFGIGASSITYLIKEVNGKIKAEQIFEIIDDLDGDEETIRRFTSESLIKYFSGKGISFPEGADMYYDRRAGKIMVVNTPDNIRRLDPLIKDLILHGHYIRIITDFIIIPEVFTRPAKFFRCGPSKQISMTMKTAKIRLPFKIFKSLPINESDRKGILEHIKIENNEAGIDILEIYPVIGKGNIKVKIKKCKSVPEKFNYQITYLKNVEAVKIKTRKSFVAAVLEIKRKIYGWNESVYVSVIITIEPLMGSTLGPRVFKPAF